MAGRKREYTERSFDRYFEKSVKIHLAQGIPLEIAVEHARRRATAWKGGFSKLRVNRQKLKAKLASEGIAPSARAPFYALLNELSRSADYWKKVGEAGIREYISAKYPTVAENEDLVRLILGLAGIVELPPEETPTTPAGATE